MNELDEIVVSPSQISKGVKHDGRIVYIEPTEFAKYQLQKNAEGVDNIDNITWNPEDLQFTVDLQVICPERYNKNSSVSNNTTISGEQSSEWISFMQGKDFSDGKTTSNYLTDAYTEISFQEFKNGERSPKEYLGINSIDISFDSHFFPIVNMKFTDVRAAALFGPKDNEYVQTDRIETAMNVLGKNISEDERKKQQEKIENAKSRTSSTFFKSLFRFPYPRFMLTVMGFYGDKVTFQLAVNDFKTSFNSENGNFDVNVSFIGYMYGIYTDIPMSLIFTAPYYNREYWEQQKDAGIFVYNEGDKMHTFIEYLVAYYSLFKDEVITTDNYAVNAYSKLTVEQSLLENITVLLEKFEEQFLDRTGVKIYTNPQNNKPNVYISFFKGSQLGLDKNKYDELRSAINAYNEEYAYKDERATMIDISHLEGKFKNANSLSGAEFSPGENSNLNGDRIGWYNGIDMPGNPTSVEEIELVNLIKNDNKPFAINGMSTIVTKSNGEKESEAIESGYYYYIYDRCKILEVINSRLKVIEKEISSLEGDIDESTLELISKKLKFRPSIENIYRMIFAHIETFINSMETQVLNKIEGKKNSELRKAGYLGLDNTNSDIPKIHYNYDTFISPFPLCKNKNDGNIVYPGNFYSSAKQTITEIDEVAYVEKIVSGIKSFNLAYEDAKIKIESLTDESIRGFVPSMVADVLYKNYNPYINLRDYIDEKGLSSDDRGKYIAYFFLSRLVMYAVNKNSGLLSIGDDIIKNEMSNLIASHISLQDIKNSFATVDDFINEKDLSGIYGNVSSNLTKKCCYFFKNAFDTNSTDNRYYNGNDGALEIIDMADYRTALEPFVQNVTDTENTSKLSYDFDYAFPTKLSSSWKNSNSACISCITYNSDDSKLLTKKVFINELEEGNYIFKNMRHDYSEQGESALNKYILGSLPIGEPVYFPKTGTGGFNLNEDENGKVTLSSKNATYIQYDIEKFDILKYQSNPYFRAFLLLGSLSTYFSVPSDGIVHLYEAQKSSELFLFPEALYLYYGACLYFRRNGFNFDGINSYETNSIALSQSKGQPRYEWEVAMGRIGGLKNIKNYDKKTPIFVDKEGHYVLNLFTTTKNYFLSTTQNDSSGNIRVKTSTKQELLDMEEYFKKWVELYFNTIDGTVINDNNNDVESRHMMEENSHKGTYLVRDSYEAKHLYYAYGNNSETLKALLCRDLYLLKRPTSGDDCNNYFPKEKCATVLKKVLSVCSDVLSDSENEKVQEQLEEDRKAERASEQKKALYYTLKRLYDRWIAAYKLQGIESLPFKLHTPSRDAELKSDRYENDIEMDYTEFNSFIFVDSFYRDISSKFIINPDTLLKLVKSYTEKNIMDSNASVFEFMNELAQNNNLLFASLPVYNNLYDPISIANIFTPNRKYGTSHSNRCKIPGNTYMIMYVGEPSSKLDFGDSGYDDDAIKDIFLAGEDKLPTELKDLFTSEKKSNESISFSIPVFGVTYGKQNQMYFKSVTVNMDNPKLTDYSIANLIQISYGGAHGDADDYNIGIGQDLYSIYTNRSYTCTVEMMGCINIMPMMYFQLNNIPMFRGFYIIIHVSHSIVPGNMTTKFTGVRVSRNHLGEVKAVFDYQTMYEKFAANNVEIEYTTEATCYQYRDEKVGKYYRLSNFFHSDKANELKLCNVPSLNDPSLPYNVVKQHILESCEHCIDSLVYAWRCYVSNKRSNTSREVILSSGFRTQSVNKALKGSDTSAHLSGYAADLVPANNLRKIFKAFAYYWFKEGAYMAEKKYDNKGRENYYIKIGDNRYTNGYGQSFDQFIDEKSEKNGTEGWVHVGYKSMSNGGTKQRREFLYYRNGKYHPIDEKWVQDNYQQYYEEVKPYLHSV